MLQKWMQEFLASNSRPCAVKISLTDSYNFEMLLYEFETKMLELIVSTHTSAEELYDRINKVKNRFYEDILLEQQLSKVLTYAVDMHKKEEMSSYRGWIDIEGCVDEIEHILHISSSREYKSTPILNKLMDIVQMIKHNYEDNDKRALITLFHAVMIEKENDRKPDEYYSCHYRDGIEVMNFLWDIVNDYAGYTSLYYDEMKMTEEEEWKAKIKPMRQNHDDPYLRDDYPHVLLVIEKAEKSAYYEWYKSSWLAWNSHYAIL